MGDYLNEIIEENEESQGDEDFVGDYPNEDILEEHYDNEDEDYITPPPEIVIPESYFNGFEIEPAERKQMTTFAHRQMSEELTKKGGN